MASPLEPVEGSQEHHLREHVTVVGRSEETHSQPGGGTGEQLLESGSWAFGDQSCSVPAPQKFLAGNRIPVSRCQLPRGRCSRIQWGKAASVNYESCGTNFDSNAKCSGLQVGDV